MAKSPFMIKQDFLSPEEVAYFLSQTTLQFPDLGVDGRPVPTEKTPEGGQRAVMQKMTALLPEIEAYYGIKHRGFDPFVFQQYPSGMVGPAISPRCDSHMFSRKKWVRVSEKTLTGFIWLSSANEQAPFNPVSDVSGGKLEFPQYNFGFQAQPGTLVLFPASPYFVYACSPVVAGTMHMIKIAESGFSRHDDKLIWQYQPDNFPLDGKTPLEAWFGEHY